MTYNLVMDNKKLFTTLWIQLAKSYEIMNTPALRHHTTTCDG